MKTNILIVPGWQNSEPEHWQSVWQAELGAKRIDQDEWLNPKRQDWLKRLVDRIRAEPSPPVLITHSMGTNTTAALSTESDCKVAGAFMVCPVDLELESTPGALVNFLPVPQEKLDFPSIVIASENDPYCSYARAKSFAHAWDSQFHSAGPQGHINVDAGFGPWPEGVEIFKKWAKLNSLV